jgi:hypothetical protein
MSRRTQKLKLKQPSILVRTHSIRLNSAGSPHERPSDRIAWWNPKLFGVSNPIDHHVNKGSTRWTGTRMTSAAEVVRVDRRVREYEVECWWFFSFISRRWGILCHGPDLVSLRTTSWQGLKRKFNFVSIRLLKVQEASCASLQMLGKSIIHTVRSNNSLNHFELWKHRPRRKIVKKHFFWCWRGNPPALHQKILKFDTLKIVELWRPVSFLPDPLQASHTAPLVPPHTPRTSSHTHPSNRYTHTHTNFKSNLSSVICCA